MLIKAFERVSLYLFFSGKGDPSSTHEVVNGVIRVTEYEQTLALQPSANGVGTKGGEIYLFLYYLWQIIPTTVMTYFKVKLNHGIYSFFFTDLFFNTKNSIFESWNHIGSTIKIIHQFFFRSSWVWLVSVGFLSIVFAGVCLSDQLFHLIDNMSEAFEPRTQFLFKIALLIR